MATVTTEVSAADRPPWLDAAIVQGVACWSPLGVALLAGSLIAVGYGANPFDVYGAIIEYAFRDATSFGAVLATATPLDLLRIGTGGVFQGWAVQHRRRRAIPLRDGDRYLGGALPRLHAGRTPPARGTTRRDGRRHGLRIRASRAQGQDRRSRGRHDDHDEWHRGKHGRAGR